MPKTDKFKKRLTTKQEQVIELYAKNGHDLLRACKDVGYSLTFSYICSKQLFNNPKAVAYLKQIENVVNKEDNVLSAVDAIAFNDDLRPEVRLDALSLLSKLKDKQAGKGNDVEDKTACPVSDKDRIAWLEAQLRLYGARGKAGIALADEITKSIFGKDK